jgi:uncharacterized protein YcbK (DUF882 family)
MHRTLALGAILLLSPATAGATEVVLQPQVHGLGCLKPETKAMMRRLQARIGLIEVTSTCGGRHARNSLHYSGRAVDFRPVSTSASNAVAVLRSMPEVGGVGTYPSGVVHADVGHLKHAWFGHGRRHLARHGRPAHRQYAMR